MLRGIGISLIVLASCAWIGYVSWDVFYSDNKVLTPEYGFNEVLDESVLKVNYPEELNSFDLFESENKYLKLAPNKLEGFVLYFSKKRNLVLIENDIYWTDIAINNLIFNSKLDASEMRSATGKYIVFSTEKIDPNAVASFDLKEADKNATANLFDLLRQERTDVYLKENGSLLYQSYLEKNNLGQPLDDQGAFADVLPSKINSYLFQNHFLALKKDRVYANSVMSEWVNQGFVKAKLDNEIFLVSDYKAQQDPNLVLLQYIQYADSAIQKNGLDKYIDLQLTKDFPSDPARGFYVLLLSDKVVLTESLEMTQKIKLNYQLGNTLALNTTQKDEVFGLLTTKVHERKYTSKLKESTTYTSNIVYTVKSDLKVGKTKQTLNSTYAFLAKAKIEFITPVKDHLRKGISTFIISDKTYYLVGPDGKEVWSAELDTMQLSRAEVVDIYQNNKRQIVFTNGNKLYVLDLNGNAVNGFPYINDNRFTTAVSSVFWANQTRFLAGDEKGNLIYLNAKGGELNVFKINQTSLNAKPIVANISSQLVCFMPSINGVKTVFLEKNSIQENAISIDMMVDFKSKPYFISVENNHTKIKSTDNLVVNSIQYPLIRKQEGLIYYSDNKLHVYSLKGDLKFETQIQLSEVSALQQLETKSNNYTLLLDDVENNLYLFDRDGKLMNGFPKEGQSSIEIKAVTPNQFNVYTTLDNNLICYSIYL